ncbi:hypothetical protein C5E06_10020 [Pseudoclavibacter sp. RFBI5]|nr:hypothetical protein C5E06_10020 [Pseudoclavibacter sp. RFBI5]
MIRVDSVDTPLQFSSMLVNKHVTVSELEEGARVTVAATAAPRWFACHATWPVSRMTLERSADVAAQRRLFIFIAKGEVEVEVETNEGSRSYVLQRGQAASKAPDTLVLHLRFLADENEVVMLSVEMPEHGGTADCEDGQMRYFRDPALNAVTYAAAYGLARAPLPETEGATDIMYTAAAGIGRTLLRKAIPAGNRDSYEAALHYISLHATDPDLSPADVVRLSGGNSARTLQLAFRANGDTIVRAIRRARVLVARGIWTRTPERSVEAVAEQSGFGTVRRLRDALRDFDAATVRLAAPPVNATASTTWEMADTGVTRRTTRSVPKPDKP